MHQSEFSIHDYSIQNFTPGLHFAISSWSRNPQHLRHLLRVPRESRRNRPQIVMYQWWSNLLPVNDPRLYENIMFIHLLIKFNLFFGILLQPSSFHCFHYWEANYPKCTTLALWDWKDKYLIQSYSFLFICSEVYKREKERKNEHQKPWQHLQWQNYAKYVYIHKCTHTNTSLIHSHPYPPPPVRLVVTKQLMLMASAQEQWYHAFDQHSVWSWSWPTAIRTSNRHRNDTHRQTHHLRDAIGTTFSILYWLHL